MLTIAYPVVQTILHLPPFEQNLVTVITVVRGFRYSNGQTGMSVQDTIIKLGRS